MRTSRRQVAILLWRYLWPAGGAGSGLAKVLHRLVSLLPSAGVLVVLVIVSFLGLTMVGAGQGLKSRLDEIQTSPYMSLFGNGTIYVSDSEVDGDVRRNDLTYWQRIALDDIEGLGEVAEDNGGQKVFSSVHPFQRVYLEIEKKNGEHLPYQQGMALAFSGPLANARLIDKVRENISANGVFPSEDDHLIIMSRGALDGLGYSVGEVPDVIRVDRGKGAESVPLKVVVAAELPYYYKYLISLGQLARLRGNFYHQTVGDFGVRLPEASGLDTAQAQVRELLPTAEVDEAYSFGQGVAFDVILDEPLTRLAVIDRMGGSWDMDLGGLRRNTTGRAYNGAVFQLDGHLLHAGRDSGEEVLRARLRLIEEFMAAHDLDVRGELIEALLENQADRRQLEKLEGVFAVSLFLMCLAILIFFSIVLHARMESLGTLRAYGVKDAQILYSYALEGFILVVCALLIASLMFSLIGMVQVQFVSEDAARLLLYVFVAAELGVLLPTLYYLRRLHPAEMWTY